MNSRSLWILFCWLAMVVAATGLDAQEASPSPAQVRNVLFIVSDDLRANSLGCYGNEICQSPNLDKLAEQGVVFDHAYCQGLVCGPSRTSFMYSRYKGKGSATMGEHFRSSGWHTTRVGKIFHMRVPGDIIPGTDGKDVAESWTERFNSPGQEAHTPGLYACLNLDIFTTDLENRQSTAMPHRMFVSVEIDGDGEDQPDPRSASKAIEVLRERKEADEPFFLAVGFVRPHYPMVAPKTDFALYDWEKIPLPPQIPGDQDDIPKLGLAGSRSETNGIGQYPDHQKRMWAAYYASVTFMDRQVGRIIAELDRLGLRDSTAIVFTSDHGYHLGDHGFWQKANLHEQAIRVPLLISAPGVTPARTDSIVELVDLYPTLTELTGVTTPDDVQGVSLVPVLHDPTTTVKEGALSFSKGTSWRTPGWAYMRYRDDTEELYDMTADPDQITNLASSEEHQAIRAKFADALNRQKQRFGF